MLPGAEPRAGPPLALPIEPLAVGLLPALLPRRAGLPDARTLAAVPRVVLLLVPARQHAGLPGVMLLAAEPRVVQLPVALPLEPLPVVRRLAPAPRRAGLPGAVPPPALPPQVQVRSLPTREAWQTPSLALMLVSLRPRILSMTWTQQRPLSPAPAPAAMALAAAVLPEPQSPPLGATKALQARA